MAKSGKLQYYGTKENFYPYPYLPVGMVIITVTNTNPKKWFGGTWVAFATGRTLVGVDTSQTEFSTVLKTGGSKYLQKHSHDIYSALGLYANDGETKHGTYYGSNMGNNMNNLMSIEEAGTGDSGNLQPYITVYFWRRTA